MGLLSHAAATMCASSAKLRCLFFISVCHNRLVCKKPGSAGLGRVSGVCAVLFSPFDIMLFLGVFLFYFWFVFFCKCFVAHKPHFPFECLCEHQTIHYAPSLALRIRRCMLGVCGGSGCGCPLVCHCVNLGTNVIRLSFLFCFSFWSVHIFH